MKDKNHPAEEGFYWATTIARNCTKRRPWVGMRGGYRTIVMVRDDNGGLVVERFGENGMYEIADFTDYEFVGKWKYGLDNSTT